MDTTINKKTNFQNNRFDLYIFAVLLLLISSTGLLIYFNYYTVLPVEETWVRNYPKESSVLIFTLLINLALILIWFKIRKKKYIYFLNLYLNNIFFDIKHNLQNNIKNKPAFIFYNLASAIPFFVFFILLISLCFFNNASVISNILIDMKGQLFMAFVFLIILIILYKSLSLLRNLFISTKISFVSTLLISFACLFIVQFFLVLNISTTIHWDVGRIVDIAIGNADSYYLSQYSNNLLLFFIIKSFIGLFQFIGLTNYWLGLSIVNVLLIDLSLLVSIITIKKINPVYEGKLLLFIFFVLLIGLSPWTIVPYSDTFSMPIVSLFILFCLLTVQAKTIKKRLICASLCSLFFAIGWLIKPTIIAVVAALVVVLLLYIPKRQAKIKICHSLTVFAVGISSFILFMFLFNLFVRNQTLIEYDRSAKTPMSYSIATGLVESPGWKTHNNYGCWVYEVVVLNNSGTTQERDKKFRIFIKDKLQDYNVSGYFRFLFNKARWITSEGNFFWLGEGGAADFSNPNNNFFKNLLYTNGKYFSFWLHAVNGLWIIVFLGCCLEMLFSWINNFRKNKVGFDADLFLRLNALFIILLILFVEGRSRYLISFLPVFCIIAANGYSYLIKAIKKITYQN